MSIINLKITIPLILALIFLVSFSYYSLNKITSLDSNTCIFLSGTSCRVTEQDSKYIILEITNYQGKDIPQFHLEIPSLKATSATYSIRNHETITVRISSEFPEKFKSSFDILSISNEHIGKGKIKLG